MHNNLGEDKSNWRTYPADITRYYKSINGAKRDKLNNEMSQSMQNQTHASVTKVIVQFIERNNGLVTKRYSVNNILVGKK